MQHPCCMPKKQLNRSLLPTPVSSREMYAELTSLASFSSDSIAQITDQQQEKQQEDVSHVSVFIPPVTSVSCHLVDNACIQ